MNKMIAAIDIGSSKVCTIMGTIDDVQGLKIEGIGVAPSFGIEKSWLSDSDKAKDSIGKSIKKAEIMAGYKLTSACIGTAGLHITPMNNKGAIALNREDQTIAQEDLDCAMRMAISNANTGDRNILQIIPQSFVVDGQNVQNPLGLSRSQLSVEVMIVTTSGDQIENLKKCVHENNVIVDDIFLDILASSEVILSKGKSKQAYF